MGEAQRLGLSQSEPVKLTKPNAQKLHRRETSTVPAAQTPPSTSAQARFLPDFEHDSENPMRVAVNTWSGELHYRDRISKQVVLLQQHYHLTNREAEVLEEIVRGNGVARIATKLFVSENTIRTHGKRLYVKLDIHKKQELLDLVEMFVP
ncbi:MAG: helix-turn-helix transcriptional regulator [Coriobacteriales bacterium]|jgi:DNA-binding CsgD family transcriptional regulator|nr:helix-turn-helix transcriptional regulator [Coriobacteriales bacterium]